MSNTTKHAYLLGLDIGSSSIKASLVEADSGRCAASAFFLNTKHPSRLCAQDGQSKTLANGGITPCWHCEKP